MIPAEAEASLRLRAPVWAFAPLALALLVAAALVWSAWAANGFGRFYPESLAPLALPAGLGAGIALAAIAPRLRRKTLRTRVDLGLRCAFAFGVAGLVWPLSFALAILLQGDVAGALSHLPAAPFGLVIGALGGGLGGAAMAWICFVRS